MHTDSSAMEVNINISEKNSCEILFKKMRLLWS
jgi:hypothetical protein